MLVNLANAAITGETRKACLISLQDLRYRIQSGDTGQGYAIWRKEEFRRMVLGYAKRFSIMIGRFCACFFQFSIGITYGWLFKYIIDSKRGYSGFLLRAISSVSTRLRYCLYFML